MMSYCCAAGHIGLRTELEDAFCREGEGSSEGGGEDTVMVLLVIGGGAFTINSVLQVLEKRRPVVVVANSGGAARDIHAYCERGELPSLEPEAGSDPGATPAVGRALASFRARRSAVESARDMLPRIRDLGAQRVGVRDVRRLSFVFGVRGDECDYGGRGKPGARYHSAGGQRNRHQSSVDRCDLWSAADWRQPHHQR